MQGPPAANPFTNERQELSNFPVKDHSKYSPQYELVYRPILVTHQVLKMQYKGSTRLSLNLCQFPPERMRILRFGTEEATTILTLHQILQNFKFINHPCPKPWRPAFSISETVLRLRKIHDRTPLSSGFTQMLSNLPWIWDGRGILVVGKISKIIFHVTIKHVLIKFKRQLFYRQLKKYLTWTAIQNWNLFPARRGQDRYEPLTRHVICSWLYKTVYVHKVG